MKNTKKYILVALFSLTNVGLVWAQKQKADVLQVNTTASIGNGAGSTATANIKGAGTTSATTALDISNSLGANLLNVKDNGNVGILTTAPSSLLTNVGTSSATVSAVDNGGTVTANSLSFKWDTGSTGYTSLIMNSGSGATSNGLSVRTFDSGSTIASFGVMNSSGALSKAVMDIKANGNVGIGTYTPTTRLEINNGTTAGAIKIVDGTQGAGKVLTSDANGLASWSLPFQNNNPTSVSRALGVTYTNSTGRLLVVMGQWSSTTSNDRMDYSVNGLYSGTSGTNGSATTSQLGFYFLVPPGATYMFKSPLASSGMTLLGVSELKL